MFKCSLCSNKYQTQKGNFYASHGIYRGRCMECEKRIASRNYHNKKSMALMMSNRLNRCYSTEVLMSRDDMKDLKKQYFVSKFRLWQKTNDISVLSAS